jgi:hypothetical protein
VLSSFGALVGLPVSAGTVEGRARVILDVAEADLEPGVDRALRGLLSPLDARHQQAKPERSACKPARRSLTQTYAVIA